MSRKELDLIAELTASETITTTLPDGTKVTGTWHFHPSRQGGAFRLQYQDIWHDDFHEEGRGPTPHAVMRLRAERVLRDLAERK